MAFTTEQLESVAHGLGHYDTSHGNLPLFRLPKHSCDDAEGWVPEVGYRDTREVFAELARLRREQGR